MLEDRLGGCFVACILVDEVEMPFIGMVGTRFDDRYLG
jgi:hypothetical protein